MIFGVYLSLSPSDNEMTAPTFAFIEARRMAAIQGPALVRRSNPDFALPVPASVEVEPTLTVIFPLVIARIGVRVPSASCGK